jgi:predicted transcriptional regulator
MEIVLSFNKSLNNKTQKNTTTLIKDLVKSQLLTRTTKSKTKVKSKVKNITYDSDVDVNMLTPLKKQKCNFDEITEIISLDEISDDELLPHSSYELSNNIKKNIDNNKSTIKSQNMIDEHLIDDDSDSDDDYQDTIHYIFGDLLKLKTNMICSYYNLRFAIDELKEFINTTNEILKGSKEGGYSELDCYYFVNISCKMLCEYLKYKIENGFVIDNTRDAAKFLRQSIIVSFWICYKFISNDDAVCIYDLKYNLDIYDKKIKEKHIIRKEMDILKSIQYKYSII